MLLKKSSRRGGNDLLSITNAAETTFLFDIDSHLHGEVMWFLLWIKQTCSWLHPDCGTFIALVFALICGVRTLRAACISFIFRRPGNLFRLFGDTKKGGKTNSRPIVVGLQNIRKPAEINCCWSQQKAHFWGTQAQGSFSHSQPLRSRRQGDFGGPSLLTHTPVIFISWVTFLLADAGLWLKDISSGCIVCSRGLSNAICIMHNHPCFTYLIGVENNSGYETCKRDLWLQHLKSKKNLMIVYVFVLLYANWLMINECSFFFFFFSFCKQTENT